MIIIKCAWCGEKIGTKKCNEHDKANGEISHSICGVCEKKVYADLDAIDTDVNNILPTHL